MKTEVRISLRYTEASWDNTRPAGVQIEMTDERTGLNVFELEMTPGQFISFMRGMGGAETIPVTFFAPDLIGKYHSHESYSFPVLSDDGRGPDPKPGPATQKKIDALEGGGDGWEWHVQPARRDNRNRWVVVRRRYTDEPIAPADSLNTDPKEAPAPKSEKTGPSLGLPKPKKAKKKGKK